jgi:hypothetical protein
MSTAGIVIGKTRQLENYSIIPHTKAATFVKAGTTNRESRWLQNSRQGTFLGHLILEEVGYSWNKVGEQAFAKKIISWP